MVPFEGDHLEALICAGFPLRGRRPSQAGQCQRQCQQRLPAWSQSRMPHCGCSALGANTHTVVSPCVLCPSAQCDPGAGNSQVPRQPGWPLIPLPSSRARAGLSRPRCAHVNANSSALEALTPALLTPT